MSQDETLPFRSGFVALLGRANVGKSTLVNKLTGEKIAIVSPKPQTTRTRVQGIVNLPNAQIVLVDTPGFHTRATPLNRAMKRTAVQAIADADVGVVVIEVRGNVESPDEVVISDEDIQVLSAAQKSEARLILALNKIDVLPRMEMLLPTMAKYHAQAQFAAVVPISARTGDGLDVLLAEICKLLPESAAMFPPDMHTVEIERDMCAELVREQLLMQTDQEVPHSTMVVVEVFDDERDEEGNGIVHIEGRIIVERDSQKGIIVGKGGQRIKSLSQQARLQMEQLLGCKVFLRMTVAVDKDWTQSEAAVRRYGFGKQTENE